MNKLKAYHEPKVCWIVIDGLQPLFAQSNGLVETLSYTIHRLWCSCWNIPRFIPLLYLSHPWVICLPIFWCNGGHVDFNFKYSINHIINLHLFVWIRFNWFNHRCWIELNLTYFIHRNVASTPVHVGRQVRIARVLARAVWVPGGQFTKRCEHSDI